MQSFVAIIGVVKLQQERLLNNSTLNVIIVT